MVIYKFTHLDSGRVYIGQTIQDPNRRKLEHFNSKKNTVFSNAIQKYGRDAFTFEIIETADSLSELNELEEYYIALYNSTENGFNLMTGGYNKRHHPSTLVKMRQSQKNAHARRKALGVDRCFVNSPGMTGKKQSEYQKLMVSKANKGRKMSESARSNMSNSKKGRTWEDIYGVEGAALRRLQHKERSITRKSKD